MPRVLAVGCLAAAALLNGCQSAGCAPDAHGPLGWFRSVQRWYDEEDHPVARDVCDAVGLAALAAGTAVGIYFLVVDTSGQSDPGDANSPAVRRK
jgi:hypothetical protein